MPCSRRLFRATLPDLKIVDSPIGFLEVWERRRHLNDLCRIAGGSPATASQLLQVELDHCFLVSLSAPHRNSRESLHRDREPTRLEG